MRGLKTTPNFRLDLRNRTVLVAGAPPSRTSACRDKQVPEPEQFSGRTVRNPIRQLKGEEAREPLDAGDEEDVAFDTTKRQDDKNQSEVHLVEVLSKVW
jgi:hypothetical protein